MQRNNRIFLAAASLAATILCAAVSSAEIIDKVAVVVNNEVVTRREIDRIMQPALEQYSNIYSGDQLISKLEELRQKVMQQLIEDKLVLCEAKKAGIEVDQKDIDARIDEMKKRVGSTAEFERALSMQNLTLKDLKTRYKEQLMSRKMIEKKIGGKVTMTPVEVIEYFNEHANEFVKPAQLTLYNILIRPKEYEDPSATARRAKEVLKRVKEGEDFAELARKYSEGPNATDGGLMENVKKGDLMPEIEKVVFNLKEGQTSDIIQTSLGYHIFKVEDMTEETPLSLQDVKRDVEERLFHEKANERLKSWIDELKKSAYIAFK